MTHFPENNHSTAISDIKLILIDDFILMMKRLAEYFNRFIPLQPVALSLISTLPYMYINLKENKSTL